MQLLADTLSGSFAATPSGWLTGVGLPVATVFLGWRLARADHAADRRSTALEKRLSHIEDTQDTHTLALSAQSTGLQVLVSEFAPVKVSVAEHTSSITELRERTAELRSTLNFFLRVTPNPSSLPPAPPGV